MKLFKSLFIILFLSLIMLQLIFAGKSNQYFTENKTCESFTDVTQWGAVGTKSVAANTYYNWTIGTDSPGQKNKDIISIYNYARYISSGARDPLILGEAYSQIGNSTESPVSSWTGIRYAAYLNESVESGNTFGPRWECGYSGSPNTCNTTNKGFNNFSKLYSVHLYSFGGSPNHFGIMDVFNIRYDWCWTPIIFNANVSKEIGEEKYCNNCASTDLNWATNFNCSDVGDWEFKFNATDNQGYNATAWASGITNECLDQGVDCTFEILKDDINITHISGNQSTATSEIPAEFHLRAYDLSKGSYDISEILNVKFDVTNIGDIFQTVGNNNTNYSGNVLFYFNPSGFTSGTKKWKGYLDLSSCYNSYISQNYSVSVSVNAAPIGTNEVVNGVTSGAIAGWGEVWNFSLNASDSDGDLFNITLRINTGLGFVDVETKSCIFDCSTLTKYNFNLSNFLCANVTSSAQYKFYLIDSNLISSETTARTFQIEKDDILFENIFGNNTIANRTGNQTDLFIFRVKDLDNGNYFDSGKNVTFKTTFDTVNYDTGIINQTNSSGYVSYYFNPVCTPTKYAVGNQKLKGEIISDSCYKDTTSDILQFSLIGDILLSLIRPDGTRNYTQEEIISFLGATTDDCGDALTSTVIYNANLSAISGFVCNDTTQVGANAFTCDYSTTISSDEGWYNVTMFANASLHYNNFTIQKNNPGLFYLFPRYKLENPIGVPSSAGWGYPNRNLSVIASSGDVNQIINISLYLGQTVNPGVCSPSICINQTPISCDNCINSQKTWFRNFTSSNQGQWFYQFKMDDPSVTSTSGTTNYIDITKDSTNISYGGQGNGTTVIYLSQGKNLSVKVYDIDKNSYNVTSPSATVTFKLLHDNYANDEKIIGSAITNSSGYADFYFNMSDCSYIDGLQKWVGEINSSEPNYGSNISENFTITLQTTGCEATVDASNVLVPSEAFQNNLFKTNGTVNAWVSTSNDVYAILNSTEIGWNIIDQIKSLGAITVGSPVKVSWNVTPSTYGVTNMSMFVNSSNAGNDTQLSSNFVVYKELNSEVTLNDLPVTLEPNNQSIFSWNCDSANYRIAKLNVNWNSVGTNVRIYSYDGLNWNDILHSEYVSSTISKQIAILSNQLFTNESGLCTVKFENVGENDIEITDLTLQGYYSESLKIEDIITSINGVNVRGIETSESLINVSVKIANSLDASRNVDVELNIVDSDLNNVNSSSVVGVNINANSVSYVNFTNIPTSSWTSGEYSLNINVFGDETDSRTENLTFKDVIASAVFYDYMCNGTIENYKVNLYHPFNEKINYDVTLNLPSGWSYSGGQTINAILPGNYTVLFNVTSGQNNEQTSVNASIDYSYPVAKNKLISQSVENGDNIPILEVVREMPKVVGRNTVFDAQLSVHNKGCASTSGTTTVSESLSTGWTPANPSLLGDITLQNAQTDLINNIITWQLQTTSVYGSQNLNFTTNCSSEGKHVLIVKGIKDTRSTNYFVNNTNIGCTGTNCEDSEIFVFSKPNNSRYEKLSKIDFYTSYGWSDYGLTIGEGLVNFTNDNNEELIAWQNYSLINAAGFGWINYTINESEQNKFVNAQRTINVKSYTDGIGDKNGNVTVEKIAYTWENGKLFEDLQNLFLDVHPFIFDLPTPVLQAPINNSLQAATPVGLSWQSITPPENVNITYYVFGDTLNATTFLDTTTEALYLWRDIGSATYYWKVIASDGITNTTSNIWQFNLDVCQPDTVFSYALNYPMSYNPATDTITVWGDNGIGGREVMGNNESNAITFEQIYEFGRAVRGICAVIKPAEGSYAVLSRLELGNVTSPLNTTFVKTTGQAVDFGKQLQINFNATLISGQLSQEGSPFGGSTLSFSGLDVVDANEGEFYLLAGSKLKLYDSGVSHKVSANNSNPFRLYWNGEVLVKSSTLQNWFTIRFLFNNNSLEDLIITNVGEGFYPAVSQVGNLNSITARKTLEDGIYFFNDTNITIVNLEVSETNGSDIKVLNYTGNAILLNPTLDWGSINWTSGSYSGEIRRVYSYDLKTTDSAGANLENTTTVLLDTKGDVIFSLMTDSLGIIPQKLITRGLFDYVYKTGNEQGPHTLYIKKYGKNFQSIAKEFSAATIETIQLAENAFTSFSVSEVAVLSNITYNLPTKVSYGEEEHNSFDFSGQLNNYPIDQCQFFALFANDTKLVEGSTKNYTINYENGVITFIQNISDYIVRPVYYYGGNLTLTNGLTVANAFSLNDLYDYMQYQTAQNNLTTDLKTVDGITYSFCIDLVVGDENSAGSIVDAGKTTEFNLGYDIVQGAAGSLIDLAGVGGTGTIGAIEVSRKEINSGQNQTIFVSLADNLGNPIT